MASEPLLPRRGGRRGGWVLAASAFTAALVTLALREATRPSATPLRAVLVDANKVHIARFVSFPMPSKLTRVHMRRRVQVFESTVNVMPINSPVVAEDPVYPGVTDADQSPQLPLKFLKEEDEARKEEEKMMTLEEYQQKRESSIDAQVQAISTYVNDEVSVAPRVQSLGGSRASVFVCGLRAWSPSQRTA